MDAVKTFAVFGVLLTLLSACGGSGSSNDGKEPRDPPGDPVGPGPDPQPSLFSCTSGGADILHVDVGVARLDFGWSAKTPGTFRIEQASGDDFNPLMDVPKGECAAEWVLESALAIDWRDARFRLSACDSKGSCSPVPGGEATVSQLNSVAAVGYFKFPAPDAGDRFGHAIAVSASGTVVAAGAPREDSAAGMDVSDNSALESGAVTLFEQVNGTWHIQATLKAPNAGPNDRFGHAVALSRDGRTLAIGAPGEASPASEVDDSAPGAGAVYVYRRLAEGWLFQRYIKPSVLDAGDGFGTSVALTANGNGLLVGAPGEASVANGADSDPGNEKGPGTGAAYWFSFADGNWSQQAFIKPAEPTAAFGESVAVDDEGSVLAIGAPNDASCATGVNGTASRDCPHAGAVFVFSASGSVVTQSAFLKLPENVQANDHFGRALAVSGDGGTVVASVPYRVQPVAGAVHVYSDASGNWQHEQVLIADEVAPFDGFGTSLAMNAAGKRLVVGSLAEQGIGGGVNPDMTNKNPARGVGSAWLFERGESGWNSTVYLKGASPGVTGFGAAVGLSETGNVFVGADQESGTGAGINPERNAAPETHAGAGAVFVF